VTWSFAFFLVFFVSTKLSLIIRQYGTTSNSSIAERGWGLEASYDGNSELPIRLIIELILPLGVTAEAQRANIDWKSAFWRGLIWRKIFQVEGNVLHQPFCALLDSPVNALQLCRRQFSHKNFVADFLLEKSTFVRKTVILRFW